MYYADNLQTKFSSVRTPQFSRFLVLFCTYLSHIVHDCATPEVLLSDVIRAKQDIMTRSFSPVLSKDLRSSLIGSQNEILSSIALFPQIVDDITDHQFSFSFRYFFKEDFGFLPPKLLRRGEYYDDTVVDAVNWWTNAIFFPKKRFSHIRVSGFFEKFFEEIPSFTDKQYGTFQSLLAQLITIRILEDGSCSIGIHHDEKMVLSTAVRALSLENLEALLPENTVMTIGKDHFVTYERILEKAQKAS